METTSKQRRILAELLSWEWEPSDDEVMRALDEWLKSGRSELRYVTLETRHLSKDRPVWWTCRLRTSVSVSVKVVASQEAETRRDAIILALLEASGKP